LPGDWNATLYDQKHSFVFGYGRELISLLEPRPGERILDVGCGTGHLTKLIDDSGARAVGMDSSPSMVEAARSRYPGLTFVLADAREFSFPEPFDAVFSNATLHWVTEAERAATCISNALKSGGRFVAEFGGKGNVASILAAVQQSLWELARAEVDHGFYFPSIGEYATLLEEHGLSVRRALLFDRPTRLEDGENGLRNWILVFGKTMFRDIPGEVEEQVFNRVEDKLRSTLFTQGAWFADYRRLRVVAYKE
jgi:trans-aconitate methyltransferase